MHEELVYDLELEGLFPESLPPPRMHGTAGEILEKIADEWGLKDEDHPELAASVDGIYPSIRAFLAHQMLEDQIGKHGAFDDPDSLMSALLKEGLIRLLSETEIEDWEEEEEKEEYEMARSELDDEWTDGLWET